MGDTVKHRAAVVAEGWRQVREHLPFVLLARLRTRNSSPGKPGPSFVVWSCVKERSKWNGDDRYTDLTSQKKESSYRKKKQSSPSLVTFPFPFFLFLLPAFFPEAEVKQKQQGTQCAREPCDNNIMNVKDKEAQDYDVRRWWSVPHRCNLNSFLSESYIHYINVSHYDTLFAWCVQFLVRIWSSRFSSY